MDTNNTNKDSVNENENVENDNEKQIKLTEYITYASKQLMKEYFNQWISSDNDLVDLLNVILNKSPEIQSVLDELNNSIINMSDLTTGLAIGIAIGVRSTSAVSMNALDSVYAIPIDIFYDDSIAEEEENGDN